MVSIALCYVVLRVFSRQCVPVPVVAEDLQMFGRWSCCQLCSMSMICDMRHSSRDDLQPFMSKSFSTTLSRRAQPLLKRNKTVYGCQTKDLILADRICTRKLCLLWTWVVPGTLFVTRSATIRNLTNSRPR